MSVPGDQPTAKSRPLVSVIVPAWNEGAKLPRFLEAIERQTVPPTAYELLIVDDCSSDETANIVRESEIATLLSLPSHHGAYAARNLGIESARADLLAFTDADCVPAEDWIERGLLALRESGADLIAGRLDVPLGERPSAAQLVDFASWYDQESFAARGTAATGNLWVRGEVFSRIGVFNEELTSRGDMDLTERAVASGCGLVYSGDVVVTHVPQGLRHVVRKGFREGIAAARYRRAHVFSWLRGGDSEWRAAQRGRLEAHDFRPTPSQRLAMFLVKNLGVRLPILAGNIVGLVARLGDARTS